MFTGKRTFIMLAVLAVHQLAKAVGVDIAEEQLSAALDTMFLVAAGVFAWAKQKRLEACEK